MCYSRAVFPPDTITLVASLLGLDGTSLLGCSLARVTPARVFDATAGLIGGTVVFGWLQEEGHRHRRHTKAVAGAAADHGNDTHRCRTVSSDSMHFGAPPPKISCISRGVHLLHLPLATFITSNNSSHAHVCCCLRLQQARRKTPPGGFPSLSVWVHCLFGRSALGAASTFVSHSRGAFGHIRICILPSGICAFSRRIFACVLAGVVFAALRCSHAVLS